VVSIWKYSVASFTAKSEYAACFSFDSDAEGSGFFSCAETRELQTNNAKTARILGKVDAPEWPTTDVR